MDLVQPLNDTASYLSFFQSGLLINLEYFLEYATEHQDDVPGLDSERDNILKVISQTFEFEDAWPLLYRLIIEFSGYMERRGSLDIWNRSLSQAIEVAEHNEDATQLATLNALNARVLQRQSRFRESVARYRRAIKFSRQIENLFEEGRACTNLGYYYVEMGFWFRAEVLCCHALNIFEQIDSDHGQAHTENHLGVLYTRQRKWEKAQQHLEQACTIWQTMGDDHGLMSGYMNLGLLYNELEQPSEALIYSGRALAQAKLTGDELALGSIYGNIGLAHKQRGDLSQAESYTRQSEKIFRRFSNILGLALGWGNLGLIYLEQEKWDKAIRYFLTSLDAYRQINKKDGEIEVLLNIVNYEIAKGNQAEASTKLSEVSDLITQYNLGNEYYYFEARIKEIRHSLAKHLD